MLTGTATAILLLIDEDSEDINDNASTRLVIVHDAMVQAVQNALSNNVRNTHVECPMDCHVIAIIFQFLKPTLVKVPNSPRFKKMTEL